MLRVIILVVVLLFAIATFGKSKKDKDSDFHEDLFDFLIPLEGKKKTGYIDSSGKWHTGLGHLLKTGEEYLKTKILTDGQVYDLFVKDVNERMSEFNQAQKVFKEKMGREMSHNEKIAYFSFLYNLGFSNLKKLFTGNYLNYLKNDKDEAKRLFKSYSLVNGERDAVIENRRVKEFNFMY